MADFTENDLDTTGVLDRMLGPGRSAPATPETPPAPAAPATPAAEPPDPVLESLIALENAPAPAAGDPPPAPAAPAAPAGGSAASALDAHELSPHARPSTAEQFTKVKETARQLITGLETKVAELEAKLAAGGTKEGVEVVTPELKKELDDLRAFRERAAVSNDPAFQAKYEQPISKAEEEIFAILKNEGASDERLEALRKTGVASVDWEPVIGATSTANRYRLRALLGRHANAVLDRENATKGGPEFLENFAKEQRAARETEQKQRHASALTEYDGHIAKIPVLAPRAITATTPPEVANHILRLNAFTEEARTTARAALESQDPREMAALAAAAAAATVYRTQADGLLQANKVLRERLVKAERQLSALTKAMPASPAAAAGGSFTPPSGAPKPAAALPFAAPVEDAFAAYERSRRAP